MAVKTVSIGNLEDVYQYDDTETYSDASAVQGIKAATIQVATAPADSTDVVRLAEVGGGGGIAPDTAPFVTVGNSADLTAERALTAGKGLTLTDGGANSTATLDMPAQAFFNGTFAETFDALVTSDGSIITLTVTNSVSGDLTSQFSSGNSTFTGGSTIVLTAGSDASPQENFIYILESAPTALVKSTSNWPATEHIKVVYLFVPTAVFTQANGVYVNQNWNDHLSETDGQGNMSHLAERERRDGAFYFSGIDGNGSSGYLTPIGGNVDLKSTSGVIYQMHRHTYPAQDTSSGTIVLVKNWNGDSFHNITNLYDIVADSGGNTISNNKWFNLVIWGVGNKDGEFGAVLINLPAGFYNSQSNAEGDVDGHDDFSMPREFGLESSTGFLIARITIKMKTGGGIWLVGSTVDLRGQTPTTAVGGAASIAVDFPDNTFTIFDNVDNTKVVAFDVGANVSAATTRTLTVPDVDSTILTLETVNDENVVIAGRMFS